MRHAADRREAIGRTAHLPGGVGVIEFERIGPNNRWQSRARFVIGRQIKREGQLNAVFAFVTHKRRRRVGEAGQGLFVVAAGAANEIVGRRGLGFITGDKLRAIISQQRLESFIAVLVAAEEAFGLERGEIEFVEKGLVAFLRRALPR